MPATLLPAVGETIQVCSDVTRSQNHGQPERQETGAHDECWGRVTWVHAWHRSRVPENSLVSTAQPDKKKVCAEKTSNSWTCSATSVPSSEFRTITPCALFVL